MLAVFPVWMSVARELENSSMGGIWGGVWGIGMVYGVACGELFRVIYGGHMGSWGGIRP